VCACAFSTRNNRHCYRPFLCLMEEKGSVGLHAPLRLPHTTSSFRLPSARSLTLIDPLATSNTHAHPPNTTSSAGQQISSPWTNPFLLLLLLPLLLLFHPITLSSCPKCNYRSMFDLFFYSFIFRLYTGTPCTTSQCRQWCRTK
jgi:hypothetical protein